MPTLSATLFRHGDPKETANKARKNLLIADRKDTLPKMQEDIADTEKTNIASAKAPNAINRILIDSETLTETHSVADHGDRKSTWSDAETMALLEEHVMSVG